MEHRLTFNVKKEDFIENYLKTLNGIFELNKPEFRITKYLIENNITITKDSYKELAEKWDLVLSNAKQQIKNLEQKKILVRRGEELVINPVVYSGSKTVVINFNVI